MDGIFISGRRPKSKKEVKEAVATKPDYVRVECTSLVGGGFDGSPVNMKDGQQIHFVGPDPYTSRKFYGTIKRKGDKLVVT